LEAGEFAFDRGGVAGELGNEVGFVGGRGFDEGERAEGGDEVLHRHRFGRGVNRRGSEQGRDSLERGAISCEFRQGAETVVGFIRSRRGVNVEAQKSPHG
jgi:hypothetical protein